MTSGNPVQDRLGRLTPPEGAPAYIDVEALRQSGDQAPALLLALKNALQNANQALAEAFWEGAPIDLLVRTRAWVIEQILLVSWQRCFADDQEMALVAVGGFGRGDLQPHSDIDLMILLSDGPDVERDTHNIERFVMLLWDAGFHLGHSVRTLEECEREARRDVVTLTNLMEARWLAGKRSLVQEMRGAIDRDRMWSAGEFFEAKFSEQLQRHERFGDTAYNLEPNIKEGPGGLRDIQMIGWVAKRHFGGDDLHGLVKHGFLTEPEFEELSQGQKFLWRIRFALHLLADRAEDRLLFDFQRQIAERFDYSAGADPNQAIESFMQEYYRVVMQLERLNERLLQLFQEILRPDDSHDGEFFAEGFRVTHGFLEVTDETLFIQRPIALIEVFLLLAQREDVHGIRAATIRLIGDSLDLIDDAFREDPEVMRCFLTLLQQTSGVYTQLQRMNRYGVLAALIPAFAQVTGRMQFDLFHVYTVDQHILFVVRNLRRFAYGKYSSMFPRARELFRTVDHPEILYLAALFHDIAKGRGGDHSELGAQDAEAFCAGLPLPEPHRNRVVWLVEQHLLMSQTAQRKDITDPEIVHEFAMAMGNVTRLKYLYLLTMADVAATSPKLWNSWKDGLLWELYSATRNTLALGMDAPLDRQSQAEQQRMLTREALIGRGSEPGSVDALLGALPESAFLRFSPGQMQWVATRLIAFDDPGGALVEVRNRADRAITEVFVSAPDFVGLIAATTTVFDEMGLNVLAARIVTTRDERSFDLFQVMDANDAPLDESLSERLRERLQSVLTGQEVPDLVYRKLPRRLRPFVTAPEIGFTTARGDSVTAVEIFCSDQPGLLSKIASAMVACEIKIHDAMIATFGDRVEDTFLVSDRQDRLLDEKRRKDLVDTIHRMLSM